MIPMLDYRAPNRAVYVGQMTTGESLLQRKNARKLLANRIRFLCLLFFIVLTTLSTSAKEPSRFEIIKSPAKNLVAGLPLANGDALLLTLDQLSLLKHNANTLRSLQNVCFFRHHNRAIEEKHSCRIHPVGLGFNINGVLALPENSSAFVAFPEVAPPSELKFVAQIRMGPTQLFAFGGSPAREYPQTFPSKSIFSYDFQRHSWRILPETYFGSISSALTKLRNGNVLITGGNSRSGRSHTAQMFNTQTQKVTNVSPMHLSREGHSLTLLTTGDVLVVGGTGSDGQSVRQCEIFDHRNSRFFLDDSLNIPRTGHSACRLLDGRVLILGGQYLHRRGFDIEAPIIHQIEIYTQRGK